MCATAQKYPGLILVAHTKEKAKSAYEAIVSGCVSEIICDEPFAAELNRLIERAISKRDWNR